MALRLYMDHNVRRPVTTGLRLRGVEVLTAFEDGHHAADDPDLLDRSGALGHVLFSQDEDLLAEAVRRQRVDELFSGLVYCHQERLGIGALVEELELVAKASELSELENRIVYLPL
jgi:hypothetical protein